MDGLMVLLGIGTEELSVVPHHPPPESHPQSHLPLGEGRGGEGPESQINKCPERRNER